MAQVAVADPTPSNSLAFPFGGGTSMVHGNATKKRKTPSELRVCTFFWLSNVGCLHHGLQFRRFSAKFGGGEAEAGDGGRG